jgi:hypothetical protein
MSFDEKRGGNGFTKLYYQKKVIPELDKQFPEN